MPDVISATNEKYFTLNILGEILSKQVLFIGNAGNIIGNPILVRNIITQKIAVNGSTTK